MATRERRGVRASGAGRTARKWIGFVVYAISAALAASASAAILTSYTQTQTLPVPPASAFAGSGGGDGWAVALTPAAVYNVFHHNSVTTVACHNQTDASPCWSPITVVDGSGHNFASGGLPALWIDQAAQKLYVYGTRDDGTGGVICFDTVKAAASANPFCGFTPLTGVGEAQLAGLSLISNAMMVGTRWYAFNYVNGVGSAGAQNKLLCFDTATLAACAGQPFTVAFGAGNVSVGTFPSPATAAFGTQIVIPIVTTGGSEQLACFDTSTSGACAGAWPISITPGYASVNGAAFPVLSGAGAITGFCLPSGSEPCYTLAGASLATPAGMPAAMPPTTPWNGPAVVIGPRIYLANGNSDQVFCYDYSTSAACPSFPKSTPGASYIYTVNPDPQRPTCIWINGDNGAAQIQNFDAFSGAGCGAGGIRVLAASFVVPDPVCTPSTYEKLQVIAPAPGTYTSGLVTFTAGNGAAIPGVPPLPLDGTGSVSLVGLSLNTATGLPQFLIELTGGGAASAVTVKLDWTGVENPICLGAAPPPPPTGPTPVPTLSNWLLLVLAALLAWTTRTALARSRRR
jgi:hypothetical protein